MRGWSNMDVLVDGFNLTKADKKRQEKLEKINKINIHLQALFGAVENGQLEKAKNILQNNTFDINCSNDDGLTVLEVAILSGHSSMIKTLQQAGATESTIGIDQRIKHFDKLVMVAECRKGELSSLIVAGNYPKETERQHALWDRRCKNLKKIKNGFDKLQVPGKPKYATVEVIDGTRVRVGFHDSFIHQSPILTKFRVEWSINEWSTVEGSLELFDLRRITAVIEGLVQGCRHQFRVSAGNMKGYGPHVDTSPPSAVPSSWRDIDTRKPRVDGLLQELDKLFKQVRNSRPDHASEIKAIEPGQETPVVNRKAQKKKSLMHLFTHAPKFQKNLKRGSYFTCIIYCEDKVLLTTEDFPPVIEVDENYLSQAKFHFHWLMKVATTWEDVKSLRQDMEQAGSASHVPYRMMFLQAAAHMQSALGIQDLGQFYHKTIKDNSGTYVFSSVKQIKSTKLISAMNVRWVAISKLRDRRPVSQNSSPQPDDCSPNAGDILFNTIEEQISYSQVSQLMLKRGLYIGYLKLQSLVDQLQVIVPQKIPNMFPHVKIRENPHVSREEWEWVKQLSKRSTVNDPHKMETNLTFSSPSHAQCTWQQQLTSGIRKLLKELGIDEKIWNQHRLYTDEVLDLNCDVTILLLLPAIESVCCAPGQKDTLLSRPGLIALPLHTFEMIHMGSYQGHLLSRYARLSYILEMDILMAQHASREAFSEDEMIIAKDRLAQLKQFQVYIDNVWKKFRWVMDSITFARDKSISGLLLTALSENVLISTNTSSMKCLSGQETSSNNLKEFIFNVEEDYNINIPQTKNKYRKKDEKRIIKSYTSENLSGANKCECSIQKSKTSECIFYSSYHKINDYDPSSDINSNSETHLNWKAQTTLGNSMYKKDCATAKSESLLQCAEILALPPRKSSAPSFLGVDDEVSRLKSNDDWGMESSSSSVSLDVFTSGNIACIKENNNITSHVLQPKVSCSEQSRKPSSDSKRASSSMSHASETSFSSMTASLRSLSSNDTETDALSLLSRSSNRSEMTDSKKGTDCDNEIRKKLEEPAIIQVYAAYDTGLASGTSVKLHVTPRTTAREVIDLVVKQLNMAVVLKNLTNPIYGNEKLKDFCLVAVIGARERCFRDDFKPLQLQNPWKKGRLYVRLKQDVLAAIEQSNSRNSSYL